MHAMTKIPLLLGLTVFSLNPLILPSFAAEKFECPATLKPSTPAKLEEIKGLLPDGNAMADVGRLNSTIATLRREGMPNMRIIDHLVTAYCPVVAQESSVTNADKLARVRRFAGQVTRLVYSLESGLDVIINVPLTPDVVDAINTTARRQGLSGPAWIAMTVENALQR
jgi:hypothetical protein